jgi:hypothetical protein
MLFTIKQETEKKINLRSTVGYAVRTILQYIGNLKGTHSVPYRAYLTKLKA